MSGWMKDFSTHECWIPFCLRSSPPISSFVSCNRYCFPPINFLGLLLYKNFLDSKKINKMDSDSWFLFPFPRIIGSYGLFVGVDTSINDRPSCLFPSCGRYSSLILSSYLHRFVIPCSFFLSLTEIKMN